MKRLLLLLPITLLLCGCSRVYNCKTDMWEVYKYHFAYESTGYLCSNDFWQDGCMERYRCELAR